MPITIQRTLDNDYIEAYLSLKKSLKKISKINLFTRSKNSNGRMRPWPNLMYYPGISLAELKKPIKTVPRSPGGDLNPGPPEYEPGVPTTLPRRSVVHTPKSVRSGAVE